MYIILRVLLKQKIITTFYSHWIISNYIRLWKFFNFLSLSEMYLSSQLWLSCDFKKSAHTKKLHSFNENHIKSHQAGTLTSTKVSECFYEISSVSQCCNNKITMKALCLTVISVLLSWAGFGELTVSFCGSTTHTHTHAHAQKPTDNHVV